MERYLGQIPTLANPDKTLMHSNMHPYINKPTSGNKSILLMSYLSEIEPGTELRDGGVLHRPRLLEPIDKGPDQSAGITSV